jgi:hypothetical protein
MGAASIIPGPTGVTGATGPAGSGSSTSSFDFNSNFNNGNYVGSPLFFSPLGGEPVNNQGAPSQSTSSNNIAFVPVACTISALNASANTVTANSGSADSATIKVFHNGSLTTMSVTLSTGVTAGSKGSATTTSNTFSVVAGDTLSLQLTETNFSPIYFYAVTLKCQ